MTKRTYQLHLPYYKQGDDLSAARIGRTDAPALRAHAAQLREAARVLDLCAVHVDTDELEIIDAGTHFITVAANPSACAKLITDGWLDDSTFGSNDENGEDDEDEDSEDIDDEVEDDDPTEDMEVLPIFQ